MTSDRIRPPALAGAWYPADAGQLRDDVAGYLSAPAGEPETLRPDTRLRLLMVPHAGYVYSGPTAGTGYRLLDDRPYRRVIVLAPNHRQYLERISCPDFDGFRTPLGEVAIDTIAATGLRECPAFCDERNAHLQEHAVEIQLPLLQAVFGKPPPLLPLLVPRLSPTARREAAAALAPLADQDTLWIISTDMTHHGVDFDYTPFPDNVDEGIRKLDHGALDEILAWDAEALLDYGARTGITMCGLEAMALAMTALGTPAPDLRLCAYARSGDRDGRYDFSVSYATVAGYRDLPEGGPDE